MIEITDRDEFNDMVLFDSQPVLVDFYAQWCSPCKAISPILEKLSESGEFKIVKVDIETDIGQELIKEYNVRGIPTLTVFKNSAEVKRSTGMVNENQIRDMLKV